MRPDLTFITQNKFKKAFAPYVQEIEISTKTDKIICKLENEKFANAIAQLPELVQIAEYAYDLAPNSVMGIQILELLNKIKQ